MGKYRDYREQRRHRHDDGQFSFAEPTEPSYFQRGTADSVDAEVIWFNLSKGFGFAKLSDDTKVYLHARQLEAVGRRGVSEGTRLRVTIEETSKGHQVVRVLEIHDQIRTPQMQRAGTSIVEIGDQLERAGTVKWYSPEKGFGFIAPDNGEKDVFVHATALTRSGLSVLVEGQKVFVECVQGRKGLEVQSIRLG